MEALEDRQLMSLTIEIRAADGSSSATATNGEVLSLQIVGVVTAGVVGTGDTDVSTNTPSSFGINDVTGSILSTGIYSNDVAGNLAATVLGTFQADGWQAGTQQDLNGDGNIDVGSNDNDQIEGDWFARHGGIDTNGTVSGSSMVIELGTLTYTVTHLNDGGETDINFRPRPESNSASSSFYYAADWFDGVEYDSGGSVGQYASDQNSTFQAGTPFVVKDTALNPAPVVNTDNVSTIRNTPLTVNALSNVTASDAIVSSSVTIDNTPTHGTAVVQTGGSILYTPTTGYLGADSFTYHVTDSNGRASNSGQVNISVTTPPPPVAVADSATTLRNQAVTISVLANDTDPSTGTITPSTVAIGTPAADGTATVQSDGTVLYTPDTGFTGTDTFTYTVGDSLGDTSSPGTVTVTVTVPVPPTANADTASDLEGHASTISVLTNDTVHSAPIDPTTVVIGTGPTHGTAVPQSDGTVIYTSTPGYIGTDSFTYSVDDTLGDLSNTATVSITVAAIVPPTAAADSATDEEGLPTTISVLSNDVAASVPLDPTSVLIGTAPTHGTAVPQSDGTVIYTSNTGYIGNDSFTYTVNDQYGDPSNVATVTLSVTAAPPPSAGSFSTPLTAASDMPIDVLSNVTSVVPLVASTVAVNTPPTNGTTSVNASTGAITYTPDAGFVGSDTFTYTVADANGNTSDPGTVTVNVGAELSSAKGGSKSVTFVDATGGTETVSLNVGNADVLFSGTGKQTTSKGKVTISSGSNLEISDIELSGTTKASSLTVTGLANKPVSIGGISDTAPLNSINAKSATLSGAISLAGLNSMTVASLSGATVTIGSSAPRTVLSLGTVTGSTITSSEPITSLKVTSWVDGPAGTTAGSGDITTPTITAPAIGTISAATFDANLSLSATGKTLNVSSTKVSGALSGTWMAAGSVGPISAGSINSTWAPTIAGSLSSLAVKKGGLGGTLSIGSIGTMVIGGDLTSAITAASAKTIKVTGSISGATLDFTGTAGVGSISASALTNSTITADVTAGTALLTATAAELGSATIGSIVLTGRAGDQFSNSTIFADKIKSASLGVVSTSNSGTPEGLATTSLTAATGTFGANTIHLAHPQLLSQGQLNAYLLQQGVTFGDFAIELV